MSAVLVCPFALAQGGWTQVVGGSAATGAGFGDVNNTIVLSSKVPGANLFIGTFNATTGSEVWRTGDGTSWLRINVDGFGDPDASLNSGSYSMEVYGGKVHAATWSTGWPSTPSTTMRLWRNDGGALWTKLTDDGFGDTSNAEPLAMVVFNGDLYVGIANYPDGAEVWRYNGMAWQQVNNNGFLDINNSEVSSMAVFDGMLYAATRNEVDGLEVWRTANGTGWTQVNISPGFGGAEHFAAYAMAAFDGALYLSTFNTIVGGTVYRTVNGTTWAQPEQAGDGFGDSNNFGSYAMTVDEGSLYIGTFNWSTGTEVWRSRDGTSWSQVNIDGFGNHKNYAVMTWSLLGESLFAGLRNDNGCEVWTFNSHIFSDGFEIGTTSAWSTRF